MQLSDVCGCSSWRGNLRNIDDIAKFHRITIWYQRGAKMDKHTEKSVHGGDVYRNQVELDFSVNINPFGMPDGVKKALGDAIFLCTQYPDEKVSKLSEAMAKKA